MHLKQIRWGLAIVGFLAAEASLVIAAIVWVTIYSYVINPGHPAAFYEQYAQATSPYVSVILGIPAFFLACRWIGFRAQSSAQATALALFALFFAVEISTELAFHNPAATPWFEAVNVPVKLLSCLWGVRTARAAA